MPSPTISLNCRAAQDILNKANSLLETTRQLARDIGLVPFRIAHLNAALANNAHAWQELNELATALELTGADLRPSDPGLTVLKGL